MYNKLLTGTKALVGALLSGQSEVQHRIPFKPQPPPGDLGLEVGEGPVEDARGRRIKAFHARSTREAYFRSISPFGRPGDGALIRERFSRKADGSVLYRADYGPDWTDRRLVGMGATPWQRPGQMAEAEIRLRVEIVDIRIARLSAMTDKDAVAEGYGPVEGAKSRYLSFQSDLFEGEDSWVWVAYMKKL